jgi:hypothetical protein
MVDMGRALGEDAASSAIRLGKALNDPIRGLTALRKVGVGFTAEQEAQIKTMQNSGDIMGAQKVILAELQAQFGGSGAAYAKTFSGQLELMGHELGTIGEEATLAVMPALQGMVTELRNLIPVIGPQLKAAIESVDWKALTTSVVGLTTFLIQNAETIAKVVAAVFILNTAFKLMAVASGIVKVAIALQTWYTAQLAAGMTFASVAAGVLNVALRLIPFVAVASAIALVVVGVIELGDESKKNTPYVDNYGGAIRKSGNDALWASQQYGIAAQAADDLNDAITKPKDSESRNRRNAARDANRRAGRIGSGYMGGANALPDIGSILPDVSGGVAPIVEAIAPIATAIGTVPTAAEKAAAKLKEKLAKQKAALQSFRDSVKQLYGQIKDSIMSAFSLPDLGNSMGSITRNMQKLLAKTRSFATNISQLGKLGLNANLLQQVIAAGPMAGGQLAAAIAAGGSSFVGQLNAGFAEMGSLAGSIAGTGTSAAFANARTVNNYSVNVTGGVATSADVGRAVVNAIRTYERQSGAAWRA